MIRVILATALLAVQIAAADPDRTELAYAPAPVDNPLKGLVPYQADVRSRFPHSLEFNYLPLSALVVGEREYDWKPLERMLDNIAGRGHQAVFRVFLEYPGKRDVIPEYLVRGGLKVHRYQNTNTAPLPPADVETPDYADPKLRACLRDFTAALGEKYDGDPRVGFLTAGLLGTWGEWHTYPRGDLFASKAVQTEVMDAYEKAFATTPIMLRYPAGPKDYAHAANADRPMGYHDDSFAWATLDTGRKEDNWYYMAALKAAGPEAMAKWKTQPIGGEIRPEAWGRVFDDDPGLKEIQDFRTCVEATHATWLMDSGMFEKPQTKERIARAEAQIRRMGYEFHAPAVTVGAVADGKLPVRLELENRGVAPFYYDWKAEYGLIADGKVVKRFDSSGKLTGLLPGNKPREWSDALDVSMVPAGRYTLAVRVPNPLANGHPVRFANESQDRDLPGWLSLAEVSR